MEQGPEKVLLARDIPHLVIIANHSTPAIQTTTLVEASAILAALRMISSQVHA